MRELLTKLAGLVGWKMWQKFPEDYFYTPLTPVETDSIVLELVKSGKISPNAADKNANTLLHTTMLKIKAAPPEKNGFYADALRTLLEAGAEPDNAALLEAVKMNSAELTKMLLDAGAKPDDDTLIASMKFQNSETTKMLVQARGGNSRDVSLKAVESRNLDLMLNVTTPTTALELLLQITDGRDEDMKLIDALVKAGAQTDCALAGLNPGRMAWRGLNVKLIVEKLLDGGADVNITEGGRQRISQSQTVLHKAAFEGVGGADFVRMLTARGADVNRQDKDGYTPLMSACVFQRGKDVVAALLDAGAKLDLQSKNGETALFFAAGKNDLDAVKLLLEKGANPNIPDKKGNTPLMKAVLSHVEVLIVDALLSAGADPNIVNPEGDTALTLALARCREYNYALSIAPYVQNRDFVRAKGTGKFEQGFDGETALMILARHFYQWDSVIIAFMTSLKYNPDTKQFEDFDEEPLFNVNAQDPNGDTALIKAVRDNKHGGYWKKELIDTLLMVGCDKNQPNNQGKSALYYAMEIFTRGKELDGETMLMTFGRTFNQTTGMLYDLLMKDAKYPTTSAAPAFDVNAQNSNGDTALILAVRDNPCKTAAKTEAISTILALGADPDITNNDGKRAIDYAVKKDIIDMFKQGDIN